MAPEPAHQTPRPDYSRPALADYCSQRIPVTGCVAAFTLRGKGRRPSAFLSDVHHAVTGDFLADHVWLDLDGTWDRGIGEGETITVVGRVTRYRRKDGSRDVGLTRVRPVQDADRVWWDAATPEVPDEQR